MSLPKQFTTVTPFSKYVALALFIFLPILTFFLGMRSQRDEKIQPVTPSMTIATDTDEVTPCEQFMGSSLTIFPEKTDEQILKGCDNETFVKLNYEYAKDKNFVYFKPMPNANYKTIIVDGADPVTFKLQE